MSVDRQAARGLATAFLAGDWSHDGIVRRGRSVVEHRHEERAVQQLARRVITTFGEHPPPPTLRRLTDFVARDTVFQRHLQCDIDGEVRRLFLEELTPPAMTPAPALAQTGEVPAIATPGDLAEWLRLSPHELDWFADCLGRERSRGRERLRHYRYRWIAKRSGGRRLLEAPKPRLKQLQRAVLQEILNQIAPHTAAHAFRPGRSVATFARPHSGQRIVLRVDLRNFFPSVQRSRVFRLFQTIGYPEAVARLLCGLCTNSAPEEVLREDQDDQGEAMILRWRGLYESPHLPQGAPTSPALANLAAWRLDSRLWGLAAAAGANYTRYADDLVFSGGRELQRSLPRFRELMLAIVLDEGFAIRHRKTTVMPTGGRQQVAGVVVNEHPNFSRREYDCLRALLHNCVRHGPQSQIERWQPAGGDDAATPGERVERLRNYLQGKIAYVTMINPAKGERLRRVFLEVDWGW